MKKILMIALCLGIMPMLFAETNTSAITPPDLSNANARINMDPGKQPVDTDSRAFGDVLLTIDLTAAGMPGDGYDNGGLSWDGSFLYLSNMFDNRCYVIDPVTQLVVNSWNSAPGLAWGIGHEQNLWITDASGSPGMTYEYTFSGSPTGNSFDASQGGSVWMGDASEWWPDGEIWIVAVGGSNKAYKFALPGGACIDSISDPAWTAISQRGFSYDPFNDKFFVGGWNTNILWELNNDGSLTGRQVSFSGIASLAYDWQSPIHPTPVIWLATNTATNTLYMLDADNPAAFSFPWDFEDGWQGWTHTNGQAFPAGWSVEDYDYQSGWECPSPGDSSFWVDSDASGGVIQDTAWSPVVAPPNNMAYLIYGISFNSFSGNDWTAVGVRTFSGGSWNAPVELTRYTTNNTGSWDTLDVSAYAADDSIRVFFYYDGDYDWWSAFDNVGLYAPLDHDVGAISYDSPTLVPENTTYSPMATVRNFGDSIETFDVTCEINPGAYTSTQTVTNLDPATNIQLTFNPFTFVSGIYDVTVYTELIGDANPANDTLHTTVEATSWLYYDDGMASNAWAWYDPDNGWGVQFPVSANWWVDSIACHIWDTSWPSPGGTDATFRIYDGASAPTTIRWELANTTVVRGDWNKFPVDTTLTHFVTGDNVYFFYIQSVAYPDCPGLSVDAAVSEPNYLWQLLDGAFTVANQGGDWLMRIHIIGETGVGEWVSITPGAFLFRAPTITKGNTAIEFTLPVSTRTELVVYDAAGRLCKTLVSADLSAGTHHLNTDYELSAGVYFYNLKTESGINLTRKFLLVR